MATKYYKRSNLTDEQFESILRSFVNGDTAKEIESKFKNSYCSGTRYEDTLNRTLYRIRESLGRHFSYDNSSMSKLPDLFYFIEERYGLQIVNHFDQRALKDKELRDNYVNVFLVNSSKKQRRYVEHLRIKKENLKILLEAFEEGVPPNLKSFSLVGFKGNSRLEVLHAGGIGVVRFVSFCNQLLSRYYGISFKSQSGYINECIFKYNHDYLNHSRDKTTYEILIGHFIKNPLRGRAK